MIGSAGSDEKVAYLTDRLGFDAAFNYKSGHVRGLLAEAAPDGIDVYFDNVGGDHLEAALAILNNRGRAALCGAISADDATEAPAAPRNMSNIVGKRLTLRGFIVSDHSDRYGDFVREVGGWIRDGKVYLRGDGVRGRRPRGGRVPGHAEWRQHRQNARPLLGAASAVAEQAQAQRGRHVGDGLPGAAGNDQPAPGGSWRGRTPRPR